MASSAENEKMSISEVYAEGKKKYSDKEKGLENWKADLMNFVTKEFHEKLNSKDNMQQKEAEDLVSMWISTTYISFFFRDSWGDEQNNKSQALQYLHHAQLLEQKFDDQMVIQVIDRAIESCRINKFALID